MSIYLTNNHPTTILKNKENKNFIAKHINVKTSKKKWFQNQYNNFLYLYKGA